MNLDLFDGLEPGPDWLETLGERAVVLRGFALPRVSEILPAVDSVRQAAPWRHMMTPGGFRMSVAMTNCGALGWTSDRHSYCYSRTDPDTGRDWPPMPAALRRLARDAAARAGFDRYAPDACLINRYEPGTRLTLHQDKNERDLDAPIVSVSLGIPAVFLFGGLRRSDRAIKVPLAHGDVVVWGGPDRLRYHGVLPLKEHWHPLLGGQRINLTFRKVL